MDEALNYYINFLLYAIVGKMAQADSIIQLHRKAIYEAAERCLYGASFGAVYRGVLLENHEVVDGKLKHDSRLKFLSFTENRDVARWFADSRSIMSSYVKQLRPNVEGYLIQYTPKASDVLFCATKQTSMIRLLTLAAQMHPDIDHRQFFWNATTQSEVILKPVSGELNVVKYTPQDTDALDKKFTWPLYGK